MPTMMSRLASATATHRAAPSPQLLAFADHHARGEREDARKRDVQVSEDAHLAALDHMLAKSREVAGAGASGIDGGRDARAAAEILSVDAERGPAPIDIGVQIDQPGGDNAAGDIADVGLRLRAQPRSDAGDLAIGEGDVHYGIELLRGIDHTAAAQDEIEAHRQILRARRPREDINLSA
jgi:hypothetical protein